VPRKTLVTTAALVAVLLLALEVLAAGRPLPKPRTEEIAEGVYAYLGGGGRTNSGFVITSRGVIVIDSQGPRERALDLLARIRDKTKMPVIYTINTHYHGDHTFGNQYFGGTVISTEKTRDLLIGRDKVQRARFRKFFGPRSLVGLRLTLPRITFSRELHLHEGKTTVLVRATGPAHTTGDAYVYLPREQVVFTGDILYKGRLPWLGDGSVHGNIRALDEILALRANTYIPGHGGLATRKDVLEYKAYLEDIVREVKRLHDEGKTMKEVMKDLRLPAYRAYIKYDEWLSQNAGAVYRELYAQKDKVPPGKVTGP